MRKLIYKTILFVAPFILLYCFNCIFYGKDKGDLIRLGNMYWNPAKRSSLSILYGKFGKELRFQNLAKIYPDLKKSYDIISIGDSFSNQAEAGYQNGLAHNDYTLLNIDFTMLGMNPVQALVDLLNGDFFDSVTTDYVILQTVERFAIERCEQIDLENSIYTNELEDKVKNYTLVKAQPRRMPFFSHDMLDMPCLNIHYIFNEKPRRSDVFNANTTEYLFSIKKKKIIYYFDDYKRIEKKNDPDSAKKVVDTINEISDRLAERNIKLIVLIAPDKYDIHYPWLLNKGRYIEPVFFHNYAKLDKRYIDIPAYTILSDAIKRGEKDIYFYEDTHWSPIAAQYVAEEIARQIEERSR